MENPDRAKASSLNFPWSTSYSWQPCADIYQTPDGWVIKLALAGIAPHDIKISTINHAVIIRGSRKDSCIKSNWIHLSMEIFYTTFERQVDLPQDADMSNLATDFVHGMLLITISRKTKGNQS
jgi:HSP20 family protein